MSNSQQTPASGSMSAKKIRRRQILLLVAGVSGLAIATLFATGILGGFNSAPKPDNAPRAVRQVNVPAPGTAVSDKDVWRTKSDDALAQISARMDSMEKRIGATPSGTPANAQAAPGSTSQAGGVPPSVAKVLEKANAAGTVPGSGQAPATAEKSAAAGQPGATSAAPAPAQPKIPPNILKQLGGQPPAPKASGKGAPATFPPSPLQALAGAPMDSGAGGARSDRNIERIVFEPEKIEAAGQQRMVEKKPGVRSVQIPATSFARGRLLNGVNAPTGGQAQSNPIAAIVQITSFANLSNRFQHDIRECRILLAANGSLSDERMYGRLETLTCIHSDGRVQEVEVKGYINGNDGKNGVRGRSVNKQGQVLANALTAGIFSGFGTAVQAGATITNQNALGATSVISPGAGFRSGMGGGISRAMDRLADFYIRSAEQLFPVIEVDAGVEVDVVFSRGFQLKVSDAGDATDESGEFTAIAARNEGVRKHVQH